MLIQMLVWPLLCFHHESGKWHKTTSSLNTEVWKVRNGQDSKQENKLWYQFYMSGLDTGFQSHSVGQAGLELSIFLPQLLGVGGHIHSSPVFCSHCLGTQFSYRFTGLKMHSVVFVFLHIYTLTGGDNHCSVNLTERTWKDFDLHKPFPCSHHLFGEVLQLPCVDTRVGFYEDTGKESMAFDLKVKGDFATSEWFGSRRWPESPWAEAVLRNTKLG